jgi:Type II restriction endonuclease, TdeIII
LPLTDETRQQIKDYLQREVERYIREGLANRAIIERIPFHARLMPTLFGVPLSERSFSTRSGSWFQTMAKIVASQYHKKAAIGHRVIGDIQPAAETLINEWVEQMKALGPDRARPNRLEDIKRVMAAQFAQGGVRKSITSDLFILTHDDLELYFEMKTIAPNLDTSEKMKRRILRISVLRNQYRVNARASMAYNPAGEDRSYSEYPGSRYALQFLELNTDLIVGRPFWTLIGDEHTYDELLEISEEVGRSTAHLLPEP